jgi:alcohol dehydrogenase class IV
MSIQLVKDVVPNTQIFFGKDSIYELDLPKGNVLLVISPSLDSVFVQRFIFYFNNLNVNFILVSKSSGEPWSECIDNSFANITKKWSGVVGIGGGSVLDYAKALAVLSGNGGSISDYEFGDRKIQAITPLWLIPTTCGSGSEVTQYCVINNSSTGRKFTLAHDLLKPVQTAVDSELLKFIPARVRLETGLDAFTHCIEALLNCDRDVRVDRVSEEGLRIAYVILPKALDSNPSPELLEKLATLSLYGGTSISYNRTGLIHTLSVAFAPFMKMSHGLLNANLMYYALAYTLPHYDGRLKKIISNMFNTKIHSDEDALEKLVSWLDAIIGSTGFVVKGDLSNEKTKIVNRLLQDKGLSNVTYGGINKNSIFDVVDRIINEAR